MIMRVRDLNIGTMNASKSAQLLIKAYNLIERQKKKVLIFKPATDSRDGEFVVSRALEDKRPAIVISPSQNGLMSMETWFQKPDVILVDEVQFFTPKQIEELGRISVNYKVDIYLYGLLISYNGEMFEATKRAIECGFRIVPIEMQCDGINDNHDCHNDATHHLLFIDGELEIDGSGIAVEDEEFKKKNQEYRSVCYSCFQGAVDIHNHKKL